MLTPEGLPSRTDWSLDPTVIHLNHGSYGAVPIAAQNAQQSFRADMESNPCDWFSDVNRKVAAARREVAGFIGSNPESTALVVNASAGASVVFANVPAWTGMEIVTTDHTYGAVRMGAERLARRWGGSLIVVHIPLAASEDEAYDRIVEALTDNTALVVIDQITSATARELPAARVASECRRRAIPVLVDGAHAPGLFASPLVDADFWIGNLHKFACAPRSTAALVASSPHSQLLYPTIDSWGAPYPFPERFDHQGTIDVTAFLAAPTAFREIDQRYGWNAIRDYVAALGDYAQATVADAIGEATGVDSLPTVGSPVNGLRLVSLPLGVATTPEEAFELRQTISRELRIETAITSWNGRGYLRIASHVYNTADEIDAFVERAVPFLVALSRP